VHFLDFAQLNSVRALPYVLAWERRYAEHGLSVVGIHTARFRFTRTRAAVAAGVERLGIAHPVAVDSELRLWRDYGCHGWPSLFLWSRGGALRWYHLGEGNYDETELALREALREAGIERRWPAILDPVRPSDEPGAEVVVPTAELFPGGSPERPWRAGGGERRLSLDYAAGGAYASVDGAGSLTVALDGAAAAEVPVPGPGLVELAAHPAHQRHSLTIEPRGALEIYSVSFAPGVPC
jgi:hypothetical protein